MEVNYCLPDPDPQNYSMCGDITVLLVDNDRENLMHLKWMLQQFGYKDVACLETAADALWLIRRKKIDILMYEAYLPNMDGFQLLSSLGKDFTSLQVILFSNRVVGQRELGHKIAIRAMELGACAFYWKPIPIEMLRHMWQYAFNEKIQSCKESELILPPQLKNSTNLPPKSCISEDGEEEVRKQKKRRRDDDDEEMRDHNLAIVRAFIKRELSEPKKQRIRWTEDLERKFAAAVDEIQRTDQEVTPSRILGLMKGMGEEGLSVPQISSHLQQYKKKTSIIMKKKKNQKFSTADEAGQHEEQKQRMIMKQASPQSEAGDSTLDQNNTSPEHHQQQEQHEYDGVPAVDSMEAWSDADIEELLLSC